MKRLPLHDRHESAGAKLGEFAGYSMPLYYTKPIEEHHTVRRDAGVFDISHMGQFELTGPGAEDLLQYLLPGNVRRMTDGQALYAPMCREDGGILDDLIVYRHGATRFRLIVNGATKAKDWEWLENFTPEYDAELRDLSEDWCLLAVQGPNAFERLAPHAQQSPATLGYYTFAETQVHGQPMFVARTGYTGEPGCELAMPVAAAPAVWDWLTGELGIPPIGLAARDTLRLEACMALYGHDLREEWHPLESGLSWAVDLEQPDDFVGKKALMAIQGVGFPYRQVAIEVTGRGIPREGYPVLQNGKPVGEVTSGALSPTTGKSIALARVKRKSAATGTDLQVEVRGKPVEAKVVKRPFYKNPALRS